MNIFQVMHVPERIINLLHQDSRPRLSHRDRSHNLHGGDGEARGQETDLHAHGFCHGRAISSNALSAEQGESGARALMARGYKHGVDMSQSTPKACPEE